MRLILYTIVWIVGYIFGIISGIHTFGNNESIVKSTGYFFGCVFMAIVALVDYALYKIGYYD